MSGSTPGVRVTWNTTISPESVSSVTVEFRTSNHGTVVANYTTTNTSHVQTVVIQTGLQCRTKYYVRVSVTAEVRRSSGGTPTTHTLSPRHADVQVFVGGKVTAFIFNRSNLMVVMPLHRDDSSIWSES